MEIWLVASDLGLAARLTASTSGRVFQNKVASENRSTEWHTVPPTKDQYQGMAVGEW